MKWIQYRNYSYILYLNKQLYVLIIYQRINNLQTKRSCQKSRPKIKIILRNYYKIFGLIVPIQSFEEENFAFIIERYYQQQSNSIKQLITLFRQFKFNSIMVVLQQIYDQDLSNVTQSRKINLFYKTYMLLHNLIQEYTPHKEQEIFDQIIKKQSDLEIYSSNELYIELIQKIKKYIEYESHELAEQHVDIDLNEYYESIQVLKDVKVERNKEDLLNRKLFIQNVFLHVPKDETIEYQEMVNFEAKNKFIIKKAVTAFLNQQGGTLLIGIKDSFQVRGFYVGNNVFYFRQLLWEEYLDMILRIQQLIRMLKLI